MVVARLVCRLICKAEIRTASLKYGTGNETCSTPAPLYYFLHSASHPNLLVQQQSKSIAASAIEPRSCYNNAPVLYCTFPACNDCVGTSKQHIVFRCIAPTGVYKINISSGTCLFFFVEPRCGTSTFLLGLPVTSN